MRTLKRITFILIICIAVCGAWIAVKQIDSHEETEAIKSIQAELDALKVKVNKQNELINSMLEIKDKEDERVNEEITDEGSSEEVSEFSYVIENGGVTITGYNGKMTSIQIPSKIDNLPVLKIGQNAFTESKAKSITLPSSCTAIDWFAFYGCFGLSTVYISANVETIEYGAFDGCSKSLTIYCEKGSFAEKYAQSFGISYSNFK